MPIDAPINLFVSFVLFRDITQYVIWPGLRRDMPLSFEIILQPGGTMLETFTILHFSIPALRSASSNECSSCLCIPTPFVKKIFFGTMVFRNKPYLINIALR